MILTKVKQIKLEFSLIHVRILIVLLLLPAVLFSQEKEREYTEFERDHFELDLKFEAVVFLIDGSKVKLKDFHAGTGLMKNGIKTGQGIKGVILPLSNVKKIVCIKDRPQWVDVHFLNDSFMTTLWDNTKSQKIIGLLEDGTHWECSIDQVREIEVFQAGSIQSQQKNSKASGGG